MRSRLRLCALGLAALGGGGPPDVSGQEPFGAADVTVTLEKGDTARVEERYVVTPAPVSIEFRALLRRCVDVGAVRVSGSGVEATGVPEREGPWLVLGGVPTPTPLADTLRFRVAYDVVIRGGRVGIPLVHLVMPLAQHDGEREGTVRLRVRTADARDRVLFPHATRLGPTEWEARYVAIPSFVEVAVRGADGDAAPDCGEEDGSTGDDGGLTWRFLLLVGIMGAWVPLYLAWARRSGEEGA